MTDRIYVMCAALLVIPAVVFALGVIWVVGHVMTAVKPLLRWPRNNGDRRVYTPTV